MRMPGPRTWWTGARCREGRSMTQQGPKAPQMFGRGYLPAGATPPTPEEVEKERVQREVATLRAELATAKEQVARVRALKSMVGTVIELEGSQAYVSIGKSQYSLLDVTAWPELKPGSVLQIGMTKEGALAATRQIIHPSQSGTIVTVDKVHGSMFEFCVEGGVAHGARVGMDALEPGDRVLLDPHDEIAIRRLDRKRAKAHTRPTGVSWDDIGGLEDVKMEIREATEDPIKYRGLFASFGQKAPSGLLFLGESGLGKTMCGKAVATAQAELHGKSSMETGFIYAKGPDLLNKYVGESEAGVRLLFTSAREHSAAHGYPATIFLDEADGLLGRRGSTRFEGMERTIVPQFLAEMDGLDETGALIIVATNRPLMLDPALLRDGRIDRKIHFGRPDRKSSRDILRVHLKRRPCDINGLADLGVELVFSNRMVLRRLTTSDGSVHAFCLREIVSGALLAGLVHRASQIAIRRAKGGGEAKILSCDMEEGCVLLTKEEQFVGHEEPLAKFAKGLEVARVDVPEVLP